MRWVICALAVFAFAPQALADDLDVLRGSQPVGPPTYARWSGFYFGGQLGYGDVNADFSNATQGPLGFLLRNTLLEQDFTPSNWPILGKASDAAVSYGGFAGFNTQFQDLIVGIEANYTWTSATLSAPASPIGRTLSTSSATSITSGLLGYDPVLSASASLQLIDYASLRARAGWVAGDFLPYGFAGLVLGIGNYHRSVSAQYQEEISVPDPTTGKTIPILFPCVASADVYCSSIFSSSYADGKNPALMYGFSVGGGLDYALTQNLFLRGEFEFVQFAPIASIVVSVISAHAGVGLKF